MCMELLHTGYPRRWCTRSRRRRTGGPCQQHPKSSSATAQALQILRSRTQDSLVTWLERSGPGAAYSLALRRSVDELLAEDLPVTLVRGFLDDDLLVVVRQLEDDELVLLAELQVIVGSYALLGDGRSAAGRRVSGRQVPPRRGVRSESGVTDPD